MPGTSTKTTRFELRVPNKVMETLQADAKAVPCSVASLILSRVVNRQSVTDNPALLSPNVVSTHLPQEKADELRALAEASGRSLEAIVGLILCHQEPKKMARIVNGIDDGQEITLRMPPDLVDRLEAAAVAKGVTKDAMMIEAIRRGEEGVREAIDGPRVSDAVFFGKEADTGLATLVKNAKRKPGAPVAVPGKGRKQPAPKSFSHGGDPKGAVMSVRPKAIVASVLPGKAPTEFPKRPINFRRG